MTTTIATRWLTVDDVQARYFTDALRHTTAAMTRRYTTTTDTGAVSGALATALAGAVREIDA